MSLILRFANKLYKAVLTLCLYKLHAKHSEVTVYVSIPIHCISGMKGTGNGSDKDVTHSTQYA